MAAAMAKACGLATPAATRHGRGDPAARRHRLHVGGRRALAATSARSSTARCSARPEPIAPELRFSPRASEQGRPPDHRLLHPGCIGQPGCMATAATTAEGPTDLKGRTWFGVLRRTVKEFQEDNLTDWAAALTYYGDPRAVPGAAGPGVADRPRGRAHRAVADRQHRELGARLGQGHHHQRDPEPAEQPRAAGVLLHRRHRSARCGPPRPTSARSRAPRTRSTRSARAGRSGSCARSRSRSRS